MHECNDERQHADGEDGEVEAVHEAGPDRGHGLHELVVVVALGERERVKVR